MPNFVEIAQNAAEIWRFFDFSRWRPSAILDFQKLEILTSGPYGGPICVTVPNFAKIGQTVPEIWPIFDFSKWRPPPSWILEISNFSGWDAQEGRTASACQILVKSLKTRLRYGDFSIF